MATDIYKINVKLEMENAKLLKKLDQSEKKLQRFGKSAKSSVDSVKKVFAGLAAAAGAVQFTAAIKSSINAADKFAKMSQQVNVSVESLSTLQHAASLSGSSLESMDKGLRRLSTNLLDASKGLKESEESFEALGVQVTDSQGNLRDVESVLLDVADKFSRTKDSTEKTALAMKLFGKSGAELIPMLNAGSDGIREMQDEARALGLEISGPTAQAAEMFNDNMERLQKVAQGFVNALASKGLPVLVKLSEIMLDSSPKVDEFGNSIEGVSEGFKTFITAGLLVKNTLDVLATGFTSVFKSIFHAVQGDFTAAINVFHDANKSIKQDIADITNGLIRLNEIPAPQPKGAGGSRSGVTSLPTISLPTVLSGGGGSVTKSIEDANGPMAEWVRLQDQALSVYESTRTPLENLKTEIEQYTQLLDSGLISQDTFSRAVAQSNQAFLDTQSGIEVVSEKTEEAMTKMDEFAKQAAGNMQTAFADFLFDPFDKGLSGMLRGLADTLRRMTAEVLAQQALSGIFKAGASAFSGSSAGDLFGTFAANVKHGGGMAGAGVFRDVPSIASANAPRFHSGGIAANEVPAILQKGEEVLTANDPRHRNNGGGNVVNLTINATDGPSVLRSRAQIERELMAGINRAQRNA